MSSRISKVLKLGQGYRTIICALLVVVIGSSPAAGLGKAPVNKTSFPTAPNLPGADMPVDEIPTHNLPNDPLISLPDLIVVPNHGYAGQSVQVSGEGDPAFPGVRLAWMLGGATQTAAILPLDSSGAFQTTLEIPLDAAVGIVQVCAALSGTERTAFNCVDFTVDAPPPGRVQGQVSLSQPGSPVNAEFNLYNADGEKVASAPIQANGAFDIPSVAPGQYEGSVSGELADLVESGVVNVIPGGNTTVNPHKLFIPCQFSYVASVINIYVNPGVQIGLYNPSAGKPIGTYLSLGVSGQPVNVTFTPVIQVSPGTTLTKVEFYLEKPDGSKTLFATDTQGPIWQASYNASLLPPGYNKIIVKPTAQDGCSLENRVRLWVLPNPMADPVLRDTQVSFDYAQKRYYFKATVPNVGGALPILYPDPPPSIPLIGTLENKLDAGVRFEGFLTMKGYVSMNIMRTDVLVRVLSQNVYNASEHWINGEIPIGKYDQAKYVTPQFTLANIHEKTPVYSGPVVSFLGIVTLNASISIGFNGSIKMWVNLRPIEPSASTKIYPSVGPYLPISLWLTFIGIGIASMTGTTELSFGIPLAINTNASPVVSLDNPCVHLQFWLEVWIGINTYYFGKATLYEDTYHVLDKKWGNCPALLEALQQARNQPRIMAQPVVVSGPGDSLLSVYIEDGTPTEDTTTPLVKARLWDANISGWGAPATLNDGLYYVTEPSAAFVGPDGQAMVAWIQNTLTRPEGAALGADLSAILSHQEIFYTIWDGDVWSSPQQITNDSLADANPAIAGDLSGTATLAWVKDTDGNIASRTDLEIMTSDMSAVQGERPSSNSAWKTPQLLSRLLHPGEQTAADNYMDVQPSVIRTDDPDMPAAITWTRDLDGEPATNGDRNVTVAFWGRNGWVENPPQDPPPGTDSPAIGWDTDQNILYLAFLERGVDGDGVTDTGLGDQAVLWAMQWTLAGGWENLQEVLDQNGYPVRAEAPRLQAQPDQEALLLFRRFDDPGTPGMYGGLALSRRTPQSLFSPPLYLRSAAEQRWMQSIALDSTGKAVVLSVQRLFTQAKSPLADQNLGAAPDLVVSTLSVTDDPVESMILPTESDPALDPNLALSQVHALPGTGVTITATLRNIGHDPAYGLSVKLYSGEPGSGVLLDAVDLAGPLDFNASQAVSFVVQSTGGLQPLYAEVSTSGSDASSANNQGIGNLGSLLPPDFLIVSEDQLHPQALLVSWMPSPVSGALHYRILRSETPGGPYELVGEAAATIYVDLLLERGKIYNYVVQAEDAYGVRSPYSQETSAELPLITVYLPSIPR
jgi:hypothetical protein